MKKTKKGFSLIEIVIATWIITISVFWVYKMIWENTKIIWNSSNYLQVNSLFPVLEDCIENIGFDTIMWNWWSEFDFNFWPSNNPINCYIWNTNNVTLDNINYFLHWKILNSNTDTIEWELSIWSEEIKKITWYYKQIKK